MSVQIIINGDTAAESLKELTSLAAGFNGSTTATVQETTKRQSRTTKSVKEENAVEEKTDSTKELETAADDSAEDDLGFDNDVEVPDDVQLRAAASEKAKSAGKAAVKELLDKYNVANVTAVPKDKRRDFLQELEALA